MADARTVKVPIRLPHQDECQNCVLRLKESLEQTKGVHRVDFPERRDGTLTVSFDPNLINLRRLEDAAGDACSHLADQYCHHMFVIGGLDCADCAKSIERAVSRRPGVLYASVNFASSRLFLESECDKMALEQVVHDVRSLGYQVWTEEEYRAQRKRGALRPYYLRSRRALLTLASFLLLIVGSALWLTTEEPHALAILFLAAAAIVGGYPVARNAFNTLLRTHNVDMNVLMTVAAVGAAAIGEWVEAALVVALFGLGETLEGWAVERTRGSIQQLMDLSPEEALVRHEDHEERVPVDEVRPGQVVLVKPGARVPLDGVVVGGGSSVDESPITGEAMPRSKTEGDLVYAGTVNQRGSLEVRVTSLARESTIAKLIEMVEEAQGQKAPSQRWVDRFAAYYTPVVMAVAALTVVVPPLLFGEPWGDWIYRGLALLILACPCALVISTPVSIVSAIGAASRQGVLIKGGAHLEAAGALRAVAFDKTGTLTEGLPRVTGVVSFNGAGEEEILLLAASVERDSEHPLAEAIMHAAQTRGLELQRAREFEAIPGRGARARLDGGPTYHVGSPQLFEELGSPLGDRLMALVAERQSRGETVSVVGTADGALGMIGIADEVRPNSRQTVADLREAGIEHVLMLTGDNRRTAAAVADTLDLDGFRAELLPEAKVAAMRELLDEYGHVAMIGDGINDAPALATASVGIAMGAAGTDTALETADIALMADDLTKVPFTIRLSRAARRTVWQNITFALGLKVVATFLVFPGWMTLWMAVLVDTGGSLLVIGNGLRLLRHEKDRSPAPAEEGAAPATTGLPARAKRRTIEKPASACATAGCACGLDDHALHAADGETDHQRPRPRPRRARVRDSHRRRRRQTRLSRRRRSGLLLLGNAADRPVRRAGERHQPGR